MAEAAIDKDLIVQGLPVLGALIDVRGPPLWIVDPNIHHADDEVPELGSLSSMCDQLFEAFCNFLQRATDFTLLAIGQDLEKSSHHGLLVALSLLMRPRDA